MKKNVLKKLQLRKEVITTLSNLQMEQVNGGDDFMMATATILLPENTGNTGQNQSQAPAGCTVIRTATMR